MLGGSIDDDLENNACSYYDVKDFCKQFPQGRGSLNLFHLNIRSLNKNLDELLILLDSLKTEFQVIVLSETWLNDPSEFITLDGYKDYHSVRSNGRGGGVSILVRNNIHSQLLPQFTLNNNVLEVCSVELCINSSTYNVVGVYRPPGSSVADFNNTFFHLLAENRLSNNCTTILGDFNIDMSDPDPPENVENFIAEFNLLHFLPTITVPTRVSNNSATLIDHIWTNTLASYLTGVFPIHITDHYPTFICLNHLLKRHSDKIITIKFRSHNEPNLLKLENRMADLLHEFDNDSEDNIDERTRKFHDILFKAYNTCCPIKNKRISLKRIKRPWLTTALLASIDRKQELYKLSRLDLRYVPLFKKFRNTLTSVIRKAKAKFYDDKFNACTNDIKKTWRLINNIFRPNASPTNIQISEVNVNGETIYNPSSIAAEFNKHYCSVAEKLASKIPSTNADPCSYVNTLPNSFVFFPTNSIEIERIIAGFKSKGSHLQSIPSFIYKRISRYISSTLSDLINDSLYSGTFPDILKRARVVPIFKSGEKDILSNYRPISTMDFLGKIFERVVHKRVVNFFDRFDVISDAQFGFRHGRSTCDAILRLTDSIYDTFNEGNYLISVLLDFSKAFDTVDHAILLKKLSLSGIRGATLNWFKSYLGNRRQYVSIGESCSTDLPINVGVPQGSILGPLLFLIYINDLPNCSEKLTFVHFADDTTVFIRGDNLPNLFHAMNSELEIVDRWLCANKLSLNIEKTSHMIHSNKRKLIHDVNIRIRNTNLQYVTQAKFLGLTIDDALKFKIHSRQVMTKMSKYSGVLRNLSKFLPSQLLRKIYLTLVYPILVYGIEVWGCSSKTLLKKIARIQTKCIKYIRVNNYNCRQNVDELFGELKLFPLEFVYKYFTLLRLFQYYVLKGDLYFTGKIDQVQINHGQPTRFKSSRLLTRPLLTKSSCFNSFYYQSLTCWNALPDYIREIKSFPNFKRSLKAYFLLNKPNFILPRL